MKKSLLIILTLSSGLLFAKPQNLFMITNSDGSVVEKSITHKKNIFFRDLAKEQEELLKQLREVKKHKANPTVYFSKERIVENAKIHLGEPYVWGGTKPNGFDCSGYMKYIYEQEGIEIPRTAYQQSKVGEDVSKDELEKGDLLFFLTDKKRHIPVTHVGLYLGNDKFIHAASKKDGIIISSFSKSRYHKIFVKAKRIIQ